VRVSAVSCDSEKLCPAIAVCLISKISTNKP
jgi:hypothetical protein